MARPGRSDIVVMGLVAGALVCGGLGFAGFAENVANLFLFATWAMTLLALFVLALRLPLRGRGSRLSAWIANAAVSMAAIVVTILANMAVYRHDVHFDVSREGVNTPPTQFTAVIDHLRTALSLTYFYNNADANARDARDLIEVAARGRPSFRFRAIDLDKEPGLARDLGVRAYNTAVFEAEGRRVTVESTTDLARLAYAALRALKERVETICFVTGHGETFRPTSAHFHYSHIETLKGHEVPGAGDVLVGDPADLDRLQIALTEIGYETRGLVLATVPVIPDDCTVVAEIGPRTAFAAGETGLLTSYLANGGRLLLLLDPVFRVGPELEERLLKPLGLTTEQAVVIDPLNHFRTDADKVAVPYYPPHPITDRVALSVFPQARPIDIGPAPPGVRTGILAASSRDSYRRAVDAPEARPPAAEAHGPQTLAVAAAGIWPGSGGEKRFRLVLAGTAKLATNEYFPYVSNGQLAVAMLRWLAADEAMPNVSPQTYSIPEIVLTSQQMRDVFILLEVVLPLSTLLCGAVVWWRRR